MRVFTKQYSKYKGMAGRAGVQGALLRNPVIVSRKVQYLDPGRAQKLSRFAVNDYFEKRKDFNGRIRSNEQTRGHF
jgi:hypothetical protein